MNVGAGVLALQGDVREHAAVLERLVGAARSVRSPADVAAIDALVIPGGESTTMGKLADRYGLLEPLRERIRDGLPVLGTCAGMILLAGATTGPQQPLLGVLDIVVERNAFGRQTESFESDVSVAGFAEPFHAVFIRAPVVAKVGADIEVLASFDDRPVMVRQGNIVATAFHPEMTGDDRIHRLMLDSMLDEEH